MLSLPTPVLARAVLLTPPTPTIAPHLWLRETLLLAVRGLLPLPLMAGLLLANSERRSWIVLLAVAIVASNVAIGWRLIGATSDDYIRHLAVAVTCVDWCVAVATVGLLNADLAPIAPAATLPVLLPAVIRFQFRGAVASGLASLALIAIWVALHALTRSSVTSRQAVVIALAWVGILPWVAALLVAGIVARRMLRTIQRTSPLPRTETPAVARCGGLTERQCELLPLLAQPALSYDEIGERLDPIISGRTVGTHVFKMGQALGVGGGRWAVVTEARRRGMLSEA